MKRKIVITLLTSTMIATIFTGCGAKKQASSNMVIAAESSQEVESSKEIEITVEPTTTPKATAAPNATESPKAAATPTATPTPTENPEVTATPPATPTATESPKTTEIPTTTPTPVPKPSEPTTSTNASGNNSLGNDNNTAAAISTSQEAQLIEGFIEILNAKRAELGLSPVTADPSLDAEALLGAAELNSNYSHNVANGNYNNVNIGKGFSTADAQAIFDAWFSSEGHKQQMMDPYLKTVAAAFSDGYAIFLGKIDEEKYSADTAKKVAENIASDNGNMELSSSSDVGNGQSVDIHITEGADVTDDYTEEEIDDIGEQWGWW